MNGLGIIRFNYEKTCAGLAAGMSHSDPKIISLFEACLAGSQGESTKDSFLAQFTEQEDTIARQVEIYAALAENACQRMKKGLARMSAQEVTDEQVAELMNIIRSNYAVAAMATTVSSVDQSKMPLFVDYLTENVDLEKEAKIEDIEKYLAIFLEKLKIKEFMQEQGIYDKFLAHMEATL